MVEPLDPSEIIKEPISRQTLDEMAAEADAEYQTGSRLDAAKLVSAILDHDFNHPGAWQLLHRWYGAGQPFRKFQLSFAARYYRDRVGLLRPARHEMPPPPPPAPVTVAPPAPLPIVPTAAPPESAPTPAAEALPALPEIPKRGEWMNFCPTCGLENTRQAKFCPRCGESLRYPAPAIPTEDEELPVSEPEPASEEPLWVPEEQLHPQPEVEQPIEEIEILVAVEGEPKSEAEYLPSAPDLTVEELIPIADAMAGPVAAAVTTETVEEQPEGEPGEGYLREWLAMTGGAAEREGGEAEIPPALPQKEEKRHEIPPLADLDSDDPPAWLKLPDEDSTGKPSKKARGDDDLPDWLKLPDED